MGISYRTLMRLGSYLILTFTAKTNRLVSLLCQDTHGNRAVLIGQGIMVCRVQHRDRPVFMTGTRTAEQMWSVGHGFFPAGNHYVSVAQCNHACSVKARGATRETDPGDGHAMDVTTAS